MFKQAVEKKLRWNHKGTLSVEDLFDLKLETLDAIYKNLNREMKDKSEESLLNTKSKEDEELNLKIDIVKHIVNQKLEEKAKREQAAERAALKRKITDALADKQDVELKNKTPEELKAMLASL